MFQLLMDGQATPTEISSPGRISLTVLVTLVLALIGVAVTARPPANRTLKAALAGACWLGIALILAWFFLPRDLGWLVPSVVVVVIVVLSVEHRRPRIRDYLPRLVVVPPKNRPFKRFLAWRRRRKGERIQRALEARGPAAYVPAAYPLIVLSAVYGVHGKEADARRI